MSKKNRSESDNTDTISELMCHEKKGSWESESESYEMNIELTGTNWIGFFFDVAGSFVSFQMLSKGAWMSVSFSTSFNLNWHF